MEHMIADGSAEPMSGSADLHHMLPTCARLNAYSFKCPIAKADISRLVLRNNINGQLAAVEFKKWKCVEETGE